MNLRVRSGKRRPGGFTLVELAIVFLITAILATVAVYTYRGLLAKARMMQAKIALQHLVKTETIYFADHDVYTDDMDTLDFNPVKYEFYSVTVALDNTRKNFTGTAAGTGPMSGDRWFVTKSMDPFQDNTSLFFRN